MKYKLLSIGLAGLLALTPFSSKAQQSGAIPELPAPLQRLQVDGAQVRYLGKVNGLDGWVTIRQGQEQYFYVTPDKKNFLMGLLFGEDGRLLTLDQVQALRTREGEVLDELAISEIDRPRLDQLAANPNDEFQVKTPSEQLYSDLEGSNWVSLGDTNAPHIYVIVEPQCPFCHAFLEDLRENYIESGRLQVRIVPIGLREETTAQAAFLLAAPDPEDAWFRHSDGDTTALPATSNLNRQGVQHNLLIVKNWELDATPFTVYRGNQGLIKIIRGRASDPETIMADLAG